MLRAFILNIWFFLLLTALIGILTVVERKLLALIQRRIGPDYIGYRGRFQFIADALKLLIKHIEILLQLNKFLMIGLPVFVLFLCYLFWINLIWGYNLNFFEIEYNMVVFSLLSMGLTGVLFLIGFFTKNKFSILAAYRLLLINFNIDLLLNFLIICLIFFFKSFSLIQYKIFQDFYTMGFFLFLPQIPLILILYLLETNRIPFDLAEAEAELIAGYTTEMGGFFFALLYLTEYFHLYSYASVYSVVLLSGLYI